MSAIMASDSREDAFHDISEADKLVQWFGYWPSFHDAELLSIELNRNEASRIRIHTWETTSEVNAKGFFVSRKHVIVSFYLGDLKNVQLSGFNHQNVIMDLEVLRSEQGLQLTLDDVYGVTGTLTAGAIRVEVEPGIPPGSQYLPIDS